MFNHSRDLALFLEQMRTSRGISQEEFTEGIISNRQYQRYINGSSSMPFHLLDDFAERLNIKKDILLLEFDTYASKETAKIFDYFNAVNSDELIRGKEIGQDISPKYILDSHNLKLYEHTRSLLAFKEQKISKMQYIKMLKELIDYPVILSRPAMTLTETIILSNLLPVADPSEQNQIFSKIKSFLDNPSLVWTGSQILSYNIIIFMIAKYSGMKNDYKSVIHFCKIGISLNFKAKYFVNLDHYYYFLALAYFKLENKTLFEESIYRCFTVLELLDLPNKTAKTVALIQKDFGIDLIKFVNSYHSKKYKLEGSN